VRRISTAHKLKGDIMIAEVTAHFWRMIVPCELKNVEVIEKELYTDIVYRVNDVKLFSRVNHTSGVIQYFIIDINA
jgi:hypothetical protein